MDLKTLGETNVSQRGTRAQDGFAASRLAQDKAKRIAEIEARHAADNARRIRVLRAWGLLYHLTGSPKAAHEKATRWRAWGAGIIDMVAALKAEDLLGRLDEINTGAGEGETSPSRAAKQAVEVYRLAIDASAETVAKAVADGMREEGPASKSSAFREHFAEMLRWRILIVVFAAEWRRFTLADLERELDRLGEGSSKDDSRGPDRKTEVRAAAIHIRRSVKPAEDKGSENK
jgi:hypothetical protein